MNRETLKKAPLPGTGSGVLTWAVYAFVFEMLIDHKPAGEAFFSAGSIIFLIVFIIAETISYYFSISKKDSSKKEKYRRVSSGGFTAFSVLSDDLNVP